MAEEIVVIGAGIVGAACAARLTMAGRKVVVIDRVLPGMSCSFGNAGGLSPTISFPLATPDMYRQIPGWMLDPEGPLVVDWKYLPRALPWLLRFLREGSAARSSQAAQGVRTMMRAVFEDYAPLIAFSRSEQLIHHAGQLYVFDSDAGFAKEQGAIAARRALGLAQQVLAGSEIQAFEPQLSTRFKYGVYLPSHGHCSNPQGFVQRLVEASVSAGARYLQAEVSRIEPGPDGVLVHGLGSPLLADQVVLAGGAWSNALLRPLGTSAPLESQRGYHIQMPCQGSALGRNVFWQERKTLATPMDAGLRFAGTAEIAGLDAKPNERRFALLHKVAAQMFPGLEQVSGSRWMGHRPCTPDSLPLIGAHPQHRNIVCAFGHGHVGLSGAAFTSRAVAHLLAGGAPEPSWSAFSPARYL